MTSWDGARSVRLTHSQADEHAPRWSADGHYLGFLSDRDDPHESDQLWLLDRTGGEAERVTDLPGGVSDYAWSPDGARLALIVKDPDPDSTVKGDTLKKTPKPIVIDRFKFKEDETGYLTASPRTSLPVRRRHPQGGAACCRATTTRSRRRGHRTASRSRSSAREARSRTAATTTTSTSSTQSRARKPRQLTTFPGGDSDPGWGGRGPSWSPDGRSIAYVQGGPPELIYYATQNVAVIPAGRRYSQGADAGPRPSGALSVMVERRRVGALSAGGRPGLSSGEGPGRRRARRASRRGSSGDLRSLRREGREGGRGHQHADAAGRRSTRSRAASCASSAIRTTRGSRR